jgi:hypothetical protein
MPYHFSQHPGGPAHLTVTATDGNLTIIGTLGNGTAANGNLDYELQDGRPVLTHILANPDGAGLGPILLFCYGLRSVSVHSAKVVGLALPGLDVKDLYKRFGFMEDPEEIQKAIDNADESLTNDELHAAVAGYPMVADAQTLMRETENSFTNKNWRFVGQD